MSVPLPSPRKQHPSEEFVAAVRERLQADKPVRRKLPGPGGRIHIDRQLPFLCVYRRPVDRDDAGTEMLVTGEASYLQASFDRAAKADVARLTREIVQTLAGRFGAFLLLEVWSSVEDDAIEVEENPLVPRPAVRIYASSGEESDEIVETLGIWLAKIKYLTRALAVEHVTDPKAHPRRMRPILSAAEARELGCMRIGIEVKPFYRASPSGPVFPAVLRTFKRGFGRALKNAFFELARTRTRIRPASYHALGRKAVVKAVWDADERLANIAERFDFLLQVTPVNGDEAWATFKKSRFEIAPVLRNRPLSIDPAMLKRDLYSIPIERIEDPAMANLLREKQAELDRQLTMLADRNTKRFVLGSLQLYGAVDDPLLRQAESIIERYPARGSREGGGRYLTTEEFVARAESELDYYRSQSDVFADARIEIRSDLLSGLMVSRGRLLVSQKFRVPASRAEALLHHEIGTHLVTYYNGRAQRLRQMYTGLAGYDPLQEGLAVMAEYLVGGMSRPRFRLLAGRVVAARVLIDGGTFVDCFRLLLRYGFDEHTAFTATTRIFRGGGLTKDACYLAGLVAVMQYIEDGGDLEPLFLGKMAVAHIPVIRELRQRNVLMAAPVLPRYLADPAASARLARLRKGLPVSKLLEEKSL